MSSGELVQADAATDAESVPLSQNEIKTYADAYQASWCLRRLLSEVSQTPSGDATQKLYESSGNVYLSAPRKGFKCFVEHCPVIIEDAQLWAEAPTELNSCKLRDTAAIVETVATPMLEQ